MSVDQDIWPDIAIHPGETVADLIEQRGLTQDQVAGLMGRPPQVINEIVRGKKNITSETAVELETALDMPAQFWTNLQTIYDSTLAQIAERNLKAQIPLLEEFGYDELVERGWIHRAKGKIGQVHALCRFLGVDSLNQHAATYPTSFRITGGNEFSRESLSVWLRRGELLARDMELPTFDVAKFRSALIAIRGMTVESPSDFTNQMRQLCATAGVALVFVRELPKVGANGATRWLPSGNPLIQINLKRKWSDIFWFTFFHEAAHVLQPMRHDVMHYGSRQATDVRYETEADQYAADILIPPSRWSEFRTQTIGRPTAKQVTAFAHDVGIAPGVVVGRLQHVHAIHHSEMNDLRTQYVWASRGTTTHTISPTGRRSMPRRRTTRRARKPTYLYKQMKHGRISKYGITNNPRRRVRENASKGYGTKMVVLGRAPTRSAAKRAERHKIRSYTRRYGRKPWGNKRR